ncbi:Formamidopyrimidine-DNA glycosylase catalytic domain protein [Gemmatirosa kalamazoonensis]|uniref:Formamidopyrimidine-DNA glycosylase catalytic domain protein n=1 Tax=Gemmatirosa kalamazoonensis TaxID=861299 RepID=W0RI32_9BACT|nr:DNA-formamidopyrimidine glycosylase family protein [Gemmatirosa kalamazoonensis]AHG90087.1 Formamidopyrimidine-DNA glycosylase catalytic domain protein [Gemmatirosa kalamazoonensis]
MPELPDVTVYIESLRPRVVGQVLEKVRVANPFVLRSVDPPLAELEGKQVTGVRRMGKRIVLELEGELFLVVHLMIAGRLRWKPLGGKVKVPPSLVLAELAFPTGTLVLTEAGSKRRASLHAVRGTDGLTPFDRGGLEPLDATRDAFASRLRLENHTLKRALTDPRLFSGIGNAYSDEILHRARLSPLALTARLTDDDVDRLHTATSHTLAEWTRRLRAEVGDGFPEKVTAFRADFAVHGRYRLPCPDCGAPVQRIRYAENETNYCATCQTGGRLLADRAMSRLLRQDWPRSLAALEEHVESRTVRREGGPG